MSTITRVPAPWTQKQVEMLNEYQRAGWMHPFTCGSGSHENVEGILIAKPAGWICPFCDFKQNWAWDFMFEEGARN